MKRLLLIILLVCLALSAQAADRFKFNPHTGKHDIVVPGDLSATEVNYNNPSYSTVAAALDQLLYVAPSINSHTNRITYGASSPFNQNVSSNASSNTIEIGNTVSRIELFWSLNKTVTTQSIAYTGGSIGSIDAALRAYDHTGQSLSGSTRIYTLTVGDGTSTDSSPTTSIYFNARRHWGTSANTSLTSAQILALASNEFASSHGKSGVIYNCTGGLYPYYAYPASWGTLNSVTVGGLAFSDYTYTTVSHTNASGYTQNYYVYRFNNLQSGSSISVNWD